MYAGIYLLQAPDVCGWMGGSIQPGCDLQLPLVYLLCIAITSVNT